MSQNACGVCTRLYCRSNKVANRCTISFLLLLDRLDSIYFQWWEHQIMPQQANPDCCWIAGFCTLRKLLVKLSCDLGWAHNASQRHSKRPSNLDQPRFFSNMIVQTVAELQITTINKVTLREHNLCREATADNLSFWLRTNIIWVKALLTTFEPGSEPSFCSNMIV